MPYLAYCPGEKVGTYTVLYYEGNGNYRVKCDNCAREYSRTADRIRRNKGCKYCGRFKFRIGDVVGSRLIIRYTEDNKYWTKCLNCNDETAVQVDTLQKAKACWNCAAFSTKTIEGVNSQDHYLYGVWRGIIKRCYEPNHQSYFMYGARGIGVPSRWDVGEDGKSAFQCFVEDVHKEIGIRPNQASVKMGDYKDGFIEHSYHLSRLDHDKDYMPGNISWSRKEDNCSDAANRQWAKYRIEKEESKIKELEASGPWLQMPAHEIDPLNQPCPTKSLEHADFGL